MIVNISGNRLRVIILDISNVYAQIYDEGYFTYQQIEEIKLEYSDTKHWRVLILDE